MSHSHYSTVTIIFFTVILLLPLSTGNRRLFHHFYPIDQPISQPPSSSPTPQPIPQQPKYPFSSLYPPIPTTTTNPQAPFFPFTHQSPPPPPPPSTASITLPANISSLVLPSSSSSNSHKTVKIISLILSLSLFTFLLFASLLYFIFRHRLNRNHQKIETIQLFPPGSTPSDTPDNTKRPPPVLFPRHASTSKSSEFLYLGTLVSSRDAANVGPSATAKEDKVNPTVSYQRLGSPELRPLPPLPRQLSPFNSQNFSENKEDNNGGNVVEEDGFFSPKGSTGNFKSRSLNSSNSSNSCSPSVVLNPGTARSSILSSPESLSDFAVPLPMFLFPQPPSRTPSAFPPSSTDDCSARESDLTGVAEVHSGGGPPELVPPCREVKNGGKGSFGNSEEIGKVKLKPLHWDKVRACSDKTMVWDHLKSSSFQLNEEMIESLFMASSSNMNGKEAVKRPIATDANQETLILDPKKSQNIAILLRALNVTIQEVCEALVEGNIDTLSTDLLESLLKMAPTEEEERKLMDFKNDSPHKLGASETFLKSVLEIPYAFKRIEAMLYIGNFESEIDYLKKSFNTLESACKELKSSRMFKKLLEAVLRTGNRLNVGTNRGNAHAFKLDSLLKLVDIKGTDGKTTLLHFVIQEIIRIEGARRIASDQNLQTDTDKQYTLSDEVEFRKIGLQIVSALSGELSNVKKAATFDANVLSNDVAKLAKGTNLITEVIKLNEEVMVKDKFFEFLKEFLSKSEVDISNVHVQEGIAFSMVKGLTEYFHGDSDKEESRPFKLFVVVSDFLSVLDRVCKDVGKMNERTMVSPGPQYREPDDMVSPRVFQGFGERLEEYSSSDDGSSFSSK